MSNRYDELLFPEQREKVVGKVVLALKNKGQLSAKVINNFNDLLKMGKPIPGFNNAPLRAAVPILTQSILERIERSPEFIPLVVEVWAEAEEKLRDAVNKHLEEIDPDVFEADEIDADFWDAQVALLVEKHANYAEDDILLMTKVCYGHAKIQIEARAKIDAIVEASADADADADATDVGENAAPADAEPAVDAPTAVKRDMDGMLEQLRRLPAAHDFWTDTAPQLIATFSASFNTLTAQKGDELIKGLLDELEYIRSAFGDELAFFEQDEEYWQPHDIAPMLAAAQGVDPAAQALAELKDALTSYQRIGDRAATFAEERERRAQRHDLEDAIAQSLDRIDKMRTEGASKLAAALNDAENAASAQDAAAQPAAPSDPELAAALKTLNDELIARKAEHETQMVNLKADHDAHIESIRTEHSAQIESIEDKYETLAESNLALEAKYEAELANVSALKAELDAARESGRSIKADYDALIESNRALKQEADLTSEAYRTLRGEADGLKADKQTLAAEMTELRDQLRISESKELSWRSAYEAAASGGGDSAPEPMPSEVLSVKHAFELARRRYGDKLIIHLNKKSEEDYNFARPKEVWDALEWLATKYHDSQTGKARIIDLNESIRNACSGWEYKPNQTDITVSMYREWYTVTKDGATYEIRKHISKGVGRDKNAIRIAFAWDENSKRVLIGYVGPHQRTRNS